MLEGRLSARERLVVALREHALVIGEVTLTSGRTARYYVDAKRAILLPDAFRALGELVAERGARLRRDGRGRRAGGRDPGRVRGAGGRLPPKAFFVRKERKEHGLQRWIEGPLLDPGERVLMVEDVVTTGGSTVEAIERVREEGLELAGALSVLDRLAGGGEAIERRARRRALRRPLHDRRRLPGPPGQVDPAPGRPPGRRRARRASSHGRR